MLKAVIAVTFLLASYPAVAQTQAAAQPVEQPAPQGGIVFLDSPPAAPAHATKGHGRLICQDIGETGSRLTKQRVCMTADQWKDQVQRDRDLVADTQRNTTVVGANH